MSRICAMYIRRRHELYSFIIDATDVHERHDCYGTVL